MAIKSGLTRVTVIMIEVIIMFKRVVFVAPSQILNFM